MISRSGLEACMPFPERARAERSATSNLSVPAQVLALFPAVFLAYGLLRLARNVVVAVLSESVKSTEQVQREMAATLSEMKRLALLAGDANAPLDDAPFGALALLAHGLMGRLDRERARFEPARRRGGNGAFDAGVPRARVPENDGRAPRDRRPSRNGPKRGGHVTERGASEAGHVAPARCSGAPRAPRPRAPRPLHAGPLRARAGPPPRHDRARARVPPDRHGPVRAAAPDARRARAARRRRLGPPRE